MSATILIAEDSQGLRDSLSRFLRDSGYEVRTAGDGISALNFFPREKIDLIVLDLRLPRLNGIEVLQRLRKSRWSATPVVIISGAFKGDRYVEGARKLGVQHYLEKPFRPGVFLDAVREALATSPALSSLLQTIVAISNSEKTGVLAVHGRPTICFIGGDPVSFTSNGDDSFAAFLRQSGQLRPDDLQKFIESGRSRIFLTHMGLLTLDELQGLSRRFLATLIPEMVGSPTAGDFREGFAGFEGPLTPVSLPRLLYEAKPLHNVFDAENFLRERGSFHPVRTGLFFLRINLLTLRTEDIDFLDRISPRRTVAESVSGSASPRDAAYFLHLLSTLGMIGFSSPEAAEEEPSFPVLNFFNRPLADEELSLDDAGAVAFDDLVEEVSRSVEEAVGHERMAVPLTPAEIDFEQTVMRDHSGIRNKNYYELFEISANSFSFDTLKAAYFAKTRQYSPEKFMELSSATSAKAEEVLAAYAEAFNTLSNIVSKERYDELMNADRAIGLDGKQDNVLQVEVQLQSGKVFLEMGEFENAEKALQEAYTLSPGNAEACAHLAWATYRNPVHRNSTAARDKARTLLARSLQLEKNAAAFAFRGWMLLDEGRDGLAEGEFLKAMKMSPNEAYARKGLRQIAEKKEAEKKGLLKRFFS